jgi:hypothetical protein
MIPLREYLFESYGGFADRRHKDATLDHPIKIDAQTAQDVSRLFCNIFVQVSNVDAEKMTLTFIDAPFNGDAKELVIIHGGNIQETQMGLIVSLPINLTSITFLRKLAVTLRNTVGGGRRYTNCNWKWLCPSTAKSLDRLADVLMDYRRERRSANGKGRSSRGEPENPEQNGRWV